MLTTRAIEILAECAETMESKSQDYNSNVDDKDYYQWDSIPGMTMMHTKLLRYASVMQQEEINHESAEDSLKDLINYAARTAAYIE